MPEPDWQILLTVTNLLSIVAWGFPLILLTVLAYYIEKYTKFKTKWQLIVAATTLSLLQPLLVLSQDIGNAIPAYNAVANTILLAGIGIGAYASLNLLKFQKIGTGKTKDVIEVLLTIVLVVPVIAYPKGSITAYDTWNIIAQNASITLLIMIFLVIGKTIRNYIPKHGKTAYAIVVLASTLLPANLALRGYAYIFVSNLTYRHTLMLAGVILQSTANILLGIAGLMLIREAKIRGIHLIPSEEKTTDKTPMRHRLKNGFGYLISDQQARKGFEIFSEHITHRYHGLGIVRTKPDRIRGEYGLRTTPLLWMTTAETEHKSVRPTDIERLLLVIKDFIANDGNSILLIERLDYIIAENGFERALSFIHMLNDTIVQSECILLVSTNLATLTPEQKSQLLQELEDLSDADRIVLSEPLYEVLSFVAAENAAGRRPSYKRITDRFSITKTTARKRIYELENKRLIRVIEDGKFKLLEATHEGASLMKNPVGPRGY